MAGKGRPGPAKGTPQQGGNKKGYRHTPEHAAQSRANGATGGRPFGSINKRSEEFVKEAESRGILPIHVMMEAIEHWQKRYRQASEEHGPDSSDARKIEDACMREIQIVAKEAAPYMHAKLKYVEQDVDDRRQRLAQMSDQEKRALIVEKLTRFGLPVPRSVERADDDRVH